MRCLSDLGNEGKSKPTEVNQRSLGDGRRWGGREGAQKAVRRRAEIGRVGRVRVGVRHDIGE